MPQSQVYCQTQDDNGFLWLGTMGGGVTRFDGQNFKTFSTRDGLANNFVHCVFFYEDTLWVGTQKGLCYFNGYKFEKNQDSSIGEQQIISYHKDDKRTLIGTNSGLFVSENNGPYENITAKFGVQRAFITTIYLDRNNTYWVGGSQGIFRYKPEDLGYRFRRFSRKDGLATNDIECFAELPTGAMLVGTYGAGLYEVKGDRLMPYRLKKYTGNEIIHDLYVDEKLWVCTQRNGVYVADFGTREVSQITQRDGLANNHTRTILKDDWGTYWIGTSGGGVSKYFGQSFIHYNKKSGLPGNYIYSILEDSKKRLWMGVSDRGLVLKDSSGFSIYNRDSGFVNQKVKAIEEDANGTLWLGTIGDGLYTYNGKKFQPIPRKNGLKGRFIKDLEWDGKHMWSATIDNGISKLSKSKKGYEAEQFSLSNGLQSNRINALFTYDGAMWYGCQSKGIGYIKNNKVVDLSKFGFSEWSIRALKSDAKGNLWLATGGFGAVRVYRDEQEDCGYNYEVYGYESGLLSTNIYSIYSSGANLYCGSQSGIDQLTLNEEFEVIEAKHFGYDEGFVGMESCQDAVDQDYKGDLWFGTINGLSMYKPGGDKENTQTPKLSFTTILANMTPQTWRSNTEIQKFQSNYNSVSFEFVGVDLSRPKRVEYSYKLESEDEEWSAPRSGNSVRYSNLKSGSYSFHVKTTSDGLHWSEPIVYSFEIATAFYKTWWFWLLCFVAIVAAVWFFFKYRIKRLEDKAKAEREKYQMSNELLKLEHKALRLQMNPHFLFNALNSIQGLIIKNDQKGARYYLAKFAHLMRQILENSRTGSISLDEELKTLENYLLIEKLSKKDAFEYEIRVDEAINKSTLQIPPMLIQPFVENAIIHAFTGLDRAGEIRVDLEQVDTYLLVTISDNGIGRAKAGEISKQGVNRRSLGIEVTEQRLVSHNDEKDEQSITIIDVVNESMDATGTRVELKIRVE